MQGPKLTATRETSDTIRELAMCADEISTHCAARVPLPALTDADQRVLRRLYARCDGLVTAARDAQAALAPYLQEMAA